MLIEKDADFEILQQDKSIHSVRDAANYYDPRKAAAIFVLQTNNGLIAFIKSADSGKIDFHLLKGLFELCKGRSGKTRYNLVASRF